MRACLFAIQIHRSRPISMNLGKKQPWGQVQSKVRLPMQLGEPCSNRGTPKTGSAYISATAGPIWTKIGMKHPWGLEQSRIKLPIHSREPHSNRGTLKNGSAYISATAGPIWSKIGLKHPWGRDRARLGCRCIQPNCTVAVEPEKPEVPISWQPLDRF